MYFKLVEAFLLRTLFSKDEYNFKSRLFNPIKVTVITLLVLCTVGFFYLVYHMNRVYLHLEARCPGLIYVTGDTDEPYVCRPVKKPEKK